MQLTTLDIIVRRSLLEKSMPVHWYLEYLTHSASCLRELTIDTLQVVNTIQLGLDEFGSATLPDDFADDVGVSLNNGQALNSLPHQPAITPIRVHNATTGVRELPNMSVEQNAIDVANFWGNAGWNWYWNFDSYGSFTGGLFGANGGTEIGYKIIREQRRIQMTGGLENGSVVLIYVSDGQSVDNATQVDIKAQACIQRWIDWRSSNNAGDNYSPEGRAFFDSKKQLRARMNDLTVADVRQILRQNFTASIKN